MKKLVYTLLILLTAVIIGGIFLFQETTGSYYQARGEAYDIAQENANMASLDDFHWFNGTEETYFTVTGTNEEEEPIIVIVRQSDGAIEIYDQRETISEYEAVTQVIEEVNPETILETRIGMDENQVPIWEISYKNESDRLGYYLISLETGEWVRTIDNI